MKHLDITFDFETCSTAPDAAPMQLAAVAWSRRVKDNPFLEDTFCVGVDLRTCVVAGFSFDQDTIDFWSRQNNTAKSCVLADEPLPVNDAFRKFFDWVDDVKKKYEAETVCLWCQGQDFDFPILKTIARKFFMTLPIPQHYFRDCRTFVLETALMVTDGENAKRLPDYIRPSGSHDDILRKPMLAYDLFPKIPAELLEGRAQHDGLYDCLRSTWSVWQCMILQSYFIQSIPLT